MKYTYYPGGSLTPRQLAERAMVVAEAIEDGRKFEFCERKYPNVWVNSPHSYYSANPLYDIRIEQKPFAYARVGGREGHATDGRNFSLKRVHELKCVVDGWCENFGGECMPLYLPEDDDESA